ATVGAMGHSDRCTPDEWNFDAWAEWCGGPGLGGRWGGGPGGGEGGGGRRADEGAGGGGGAGAVGGGAGRGTGGRGAEGGGAGALEVLGSDEGAADRAVGGVDGLRGEVAGDCLVEAARVQRGGDASRHRDAQRSAK